MHAKTDSEVTSLAPSSPPRSPRRPMYYVQSPSRDSHDDGDHKSTTMTFAHSTPAALSPTASPPRHSHSSVGHQSQVSSSSRFSGPAKHVVAVPGVDGAADVLGDGGGKGGRRKRAWKGMEEMIEEEGLLEDDEPERGIPRRCYVLVFVLAFIALFSFFALVLWGASRNQKPQIAMKSITFENFIIQAGSDASLVPTDMATLNSTVKFTYRNTGTFFGIHVTGDSSFTLSYNELTMATGTVTTFYQPRNSQRTVSQVVMGDKVPLYGGGPVLTTSSSSGKMASQPVPLSLNFTVTSRAYVLGQLVKPKFTIIGGCSIRMDVAKLGSPISLAKSCHLS